MKDIFKSIKLEKTTPVPLYYQLKKGLLDMINGKTIGEGDMLPPESELCESLNVSRPTVRQALTELTNEGYLTRYKGKGTFVSRPKVEDRFFSKLETFNKEMEAKGFVPRTSVLSIKKITGNPDAAQHLGLSANDALLYLARLRFIDKTPLVYVETFIPFEPYKKLMDVDLSANSLYDSLEKIYRVRVNRVVRKIEAVNAAAKETRLLKIARNKAISLVRTVGFSDEASGPVEFSIARYRGDLNKFTVEIRR
jgi:GntR family transcriptional regulator